jgi:hypothetical protein
MELVPGNCTRLTNIDPLIDRIIAHHNGTADPATDRSATFQSVVWKLAAQGRSIDDIERHLRRDTSGIAAKYLNPTDRLRVENTSLH